MRVSVLPEPPGQLLRVDPAVGVLVQTVEEALEAVTLDGVAQGWTGRRAAISAGRRRRRCHWGQQKGRGIDAGGSRQSPSPCLVISPGSKFLVTTGRVKIRQNMGTIGLSLRS